MFLCTSVMAHCVLIKAEVGWLFWSKLPFETVFQSASDRLPERGGKEK